MKKRILTTILGLLFAIPCFSQRNIPFEAVKALEARMKDFKSALFVVDSLYKNYITVGAFNIQNKDSHIYEGGSGWLYNKYLELSEKYPKQCPECKTKAKELYNIMDDEIKAAGELQYRKLIQKADDCFQQQNFLKAKEYYQRAVSFMPNDQYPKDKLQEVNAILSEQEKKSKQ